MPNVNFCSNKSTDDKVGLIGFIEYSFFGGESFSDREFSCISLCVINAARDSK
jgi:hypothetical protein